MLHEMDHKLLFNLRLSLVCFFFFFCLTVPVHSVNIYCIHPTIVIIIRQNPNAKYCYIQGCRGLAPATCQNCGNFICQTHTIIYTTRYRVCNKQLIIFCILARYLFAFMTRFIFKKKLLQGRFYCPACASARRSRRCMFSLAFFLIWIILVVIFMQN